MRSDVEISKDSKHMDVAKFGSPARKSRLVNLSPTLRETSNPGSVKYSNDMVAMEAHNIGERTCTVLYSRRPFSTSQSSEQTFEKCDP